MDIRNYTVKKLGNEKTKLSKLYERLYIEEKIVDELNSYEILNPLCRGIFHKNKIPVKKQQVKQASWFHTNCTEWCADWHIDTHHESPDKPRFAMMIATWPSATEIFVPNNIDIVRDDSIYETRYEYFKFVPDSNINKLVDAGKGTILIPDPGDVYYLSAGVIHRSNRNSYNKPRLVVRNWIDRGIK